MTYRPQPQLGLNLDVDELRQRAQKAAATGLGGVTLDATNLLLIIESRDEALESLAQAEREIEDLRGEVDVLERDLDQAHRVIEGDE